MECHPDETLKKNPSEIHRDSIEIPSIPSRFRRILHVPSVLGLNWLFYVGRLGDDRLQKILDRESSSEVRKMLRCLKCKYENCIFIFRCLYNIQEKFCVEFQDWPRLIQADTFWISNTLLGNNAMANYENFSYPSSYSTLKEHTYITLSTFKRNP